MGLANHQHLHVSKTLTLVLCPLLLVSRASVCACGRGGWCRWLAARPFSSGLAFIKGLKFIPLVFPLLELIHSVAEKNWQD